MEEDKTEAVLRDEGSELVLMVLPDEEFLAALEHLAAEVGADRRNRRMVERLLRYCDDALAAHGLPYRKHPRERRFEWTGDPAVRAATVIPALQALKDPRLAGARAEFEESLGKRRAGGVKNYEDAIDEAAKSVESVMKVLVDANDLGMPSKSQGARSLFGKLTENGAPHAADDQAALLPAHAGRAHGDHLHPAEDEGGGEPGDPEDEGRPLPLEERRGARAPSGGRELPGSGGAARVREDEVEGYGSSARWA